MDPQCAGQNLSGRTVPGACHGLNAWNWLDLRDDPREQHAVSAASVPKLEEAPEPASDADGWALLEGLRRRLDDQAAQGRKTAAQVTQLAESIAALVEQQRRRSLWLNVNSFVAYLMFTVLCAAGCYLLYRSRAHELIAARDRAVGERATAVRTADDATVRAVAREAADNKAWEVYQLLEAGKRAEAVTKLEALRDQPLSKTERAVLAARVHDTQVMEVDAALKAAVAAFKAGRPGDVIRPLEAALTGEPPGSRAATIHYYLGVAYARTELDKAIAHLQAAIAGDVDQDDARFQLASVLDRSGAWAQARAEYDRFATAHPQSQLAVFAMRRSATLMRLPAVAPPATGKPAGAGGAPGLVAPPSPGVRPPSGPGAGSGAAPAPGVLPAPGVRPAVLPGQASPAGVPAKAIAPAPPAPGGGVRAPAGNPWMKPAPRPIASPKPVAGKPTTPPITPAAPGVKPTAPAPPPAARPASPPGGPPDIAAKPSVPPATPSPSPASPAGEPITPAGDSRPADP
jgi:tetratricopeptide (TPR) repeat protein